MKCGISENIVTADKTKIISKHLEHNKNTKKSIEVVRMTRYISASCGARQPNESIFRS